MRTAEALAGLGAKVHFLATVQRPDESRTFESKGVKVQLLHTPPYPVRWRAYRSLNNRPAVRAFEEAASRIEAEVIHFHNLHIHFSYAALEGASKLRRPVVLTVHDVMPFCYQKMFCFVNESLTAGQPTDYRAGFWRCLRCTRFRFNPFRNRVIRAKISRYADRVAAVSTPMKEALEQNGIPVHEVIHNGIDLDQWKPPEDGGASFRKRFGLEGGKVVLYGGRLDPLKGGLHLVRAAARVKKDVPALKLLLPGEGDRFRAEMLSLARSLDLEESLIFTGWLEGDDLKGAYAAADAVASPSLCFESFNLINLEGMAMAKPVVTSFFGGPAEVVLDGETGYLINPLDETGLADKIALLLLSEEKASEMGRAGRRRAERMFDIKKTARETMALYETLL